jgi:hypothetical protein
VIGTVAASIADVDYVQRRENIEEWLEDGTSSFLAICSLQKGFAMIKKLGISNISMCVSMTLCMYCAVLERNVLNKYNEKIQMISTGESC